jgi:imidazole glycerol-phosphate synthase subunit HisH
MMVKVKTVGVVDYGLSNLLSVIRAFEYCNLEVQVLSNPDELSRFERIVLPGVGAFSVAMDQIRARGFEDAIHRHVRNNGYLMGFCLGMQLLFDKGSEWEPTDGLGLIQGDVVKLPETGSEIQPTRVQHVGWERTTMPLNRDWSNSPMHNVENGASFYYVHGYHALVKNASDILAHTQYNGLSIVAAVQKGRVAGFQFHPEKSGAAGLEILKGFCSINL